MESRVSAGRVAANGDVRGIAAKVADILVRPLEGEPLVPEAHVGNKIGRSGVLTEFLRCKKPEQI